MKIKTAIEIYCMPEEVFSWIDNPDKAMRWQKGVKGGKILKETSERIGTTFEEELQENGKSLTMYGEIKDYIPNKLISFQLNSKIHSVYVNYVVAGDANKSTVTIGSTIKWKFPMNLICLIIGQKIKSKIIRQTKSELAELKILCESQKNDFKQ